MPIYTYICKMCKNEEKHLKIMGHKHSPTQCMKCGGSMIAKEVEQVAPAKWVCDCPTASGGKQ